MLVGQRLSVIGAGQMGEALVRGFLQSGTVKSNQILLSDINVERLEALEKEYEVEFTTDNGKAVDEGDIILLAVKPQQIEQTLSAVKEDFTEDKLVISIAAGVTTEKILQLIGKNVPVVRVMPNTPALVGQAMSVISRGTYADEKSAEIALTLFSSVGEAIEISEDLQNQATAISGSGPAYFFLLVESLIDAGIKAGLDKNAASKLVYQTFSGSAALLKETGERPEILRERVTSPGGTTAAALQVFSNHDFRIIVQKAVEAAIKRAEELA